MSHFGAFFSVFSLFAQSLKIKDFLYVLSLKVYVDPSEFLHTNGKSQS